MSGASTDIVVNGKAKPITDELVLTINGVEYSWWEDIDVTLRAEGFPPSFSVNATMAADGHLPILEGSSCTVALGKDLVITGYVDYVIDTETPDSHSIQITGRGKTQDLVDCSAEWPSDQMIGGNAQTVAARLGSAYGINVVMLNGASPGDDISQWPLNYGETGASIIQRVARNAGLLAYETPQGQLALAAVGTKEAGSGIEYGVNVQGMSVHRSMADRYSEYVCCSESVDSMKEMGGSDFYFTAPDPNVSRHRRLCLVVDQVAENPQAFTIQRALWEAARRAGRAYVVTATVDSWRDNDEALWMPNTIIPVKRSSSGSTEQMIISEVNFRRNGQEGTVAKITAMPRTAFQPEPITLVPVNTADFT
jgi:prophage tail gpP-like protein